MWLIWFPNALESCPLTCTSLGPFYYTLLPPKSSQFEPNCISFLSEIMAESSRTSAHVALMILRIGKPNRLLDNRLTTAAQLRLEIRLHDDCGRPQTLVREVSKPMNLNKLCKRFRKSCLPKMDYVNLKKRIAKYIADNSQIPPSLGDLESSDHPL